MVSFQTLIVEHDAGIATVTINRPDKLNALNALVIDELSRAMQSFGSPQESEEPARAIILTGAGDKAFVAGADIGAMSEMSPAEAKAFSDAGHRLGYLIELLPMPVIAAVGGFALGGGCELALACDFIYASERARFGQPEVSLGLMPGFGGTQRLARRIGIARARELVYTGDHVNAEKALAMGLVNEIVPHDKLMERVREVAHKIASKGPLAVAACKRVMARGYDADLATANELEGAAFASLFGSADQREGARAFLEKRKADFKGR
jgi:enoyl-CoA hydratase